MLYSPPLAGMWRSGYTNGTDGPGPTGPLLVNSSTWFNNLPANNTSFVGDAAYLMDNAGPYETGNLRSWFPYPCNPDNCRDPLVKLAEASTLDVITPSAGDWNTGQDIPGTPRQLNATAEADGSGDITVTWIPPTSHGRLHHG